MGCHVSSGVGAKCTERHAQKTQQAGGQREGTVMNSY